LTLAALAAMAQIAVAAVWLTVDVGAHRPHTWTWFQVGVTTSFLVAGAWFFIGGRSDNRARALMATYLLVSCAFSQPIHTAIPGCFPEAMLAFALWTFAADFPRVIRFSAFDQVAVVARSLAIGLGVSLFLINVAIVLAPTLDSIVAIHYFNRHNVGSDGF